MNTVKKVAQSLTMAGATLLAFPSRVSAQFDFLTGTPFNTAKTAGSNAAKSTGTTVTTLVKNAIIIFFIVVLIIAVFYTLRAAIKYIRSEGNEQKVEEAKNAIKAILMGVAAIFIAIIGIILIVYVFGSGDSGTTLVTPIDETLKILREGK